MRRLFRANDLLAVLIACLALLSPYSLYAAESIRIVSQNANRFFDNIDNGKNEKVFSKARFYQKVGTAAAIITDEFGLPDILALQEIENRNVLMKIAGAVYTLSGERYQIVLLEGNDVSAINVAYLVKQNFKIRSVKQLFKHAKLRYDESLLFSRPPLYLEACMDSRCLSLLNLHLRSMRGIRSGSKAERVRQKRLEQASIIARWVDDFQQSRPQDSLLVLGDFNGLTPSDRYVDVVGTILGKPDNSNTLKKAEDWIKIDLLDLTKNIPRQSRYSYIYRNKKQILDYMLVNSKFEPALVDIAFSRINYDFSDHAGLLADLIW